MLDDKIEIFDMHVDPLIQAALFGYAIEDKHKLDWKPNLGHNRLLWNLLRECFCNPKKYPMFNHVDLERMKTANYRGAAFGIVSLKKSIADGRISGNDFEGGLDSNIYKSDDSYSNEFFRNNIICNTLSEYIETSVENRKWSLSVLNQLEIFNNLIKNNSDIVYQLEEPNQLEDPRNNKIGIFPTLEGAHCLNEISLEIHGQRLRNDNDYLELLDKIYTQYKIRYITLHHFVDNDLGRCSLNPLKFPKCQNDEPLTKLGKKMVKKMHELGIIVDVSHSCTKVILGACEIQKEYIEELNKHRTPDKILSIPIIASHAVSRTAYEKILKKSYGDMSYNERLWWHRGLEDDSIVAIAKTGGVIGISMCPKHFCGRNTGSIDQAVSHYKYICELIDAKVEKGLGKKCVAFGSDFDGWIPSLPKKMKDCRDINILINALSSDPRYCLFDNFDMKNIFLNNFISAWEKVRKAKKVDPI